NNRAKILDFGLAKLKGASKITREICRVGTIHYMSPEQVRGEEVDHRTDIWSLGVVLYELVTGQIPFKGEHEQAVLYSILNENPEPMTNLCTGVPMELERIVNKTLAKNPSERYQHTDDLILALKKLEKDSEPEIIPSRKRIHIHFFKKPYQKFLALGIFLLIVFIAAANFWLSRSPSRTASSRVSLNQERVVVAVFENLTGDESLDVLGRMAADWVTQGISRIDLIEVVPTMAVLEFFPVKKPVKKVLKA
ncbi:MAG: protein kinase, partial [Candidatus Aminicenantes bacterium]|nr:protein kinase [Candidatus Aminicenantes bacterium]NIM83801.1 protein kinase [Candidatus Aminicenantes bacterium]NIN23251.1 protein kinase [Candidatus Aminicenantes bacterium]NIN46955.1 protein kinase [Candidatus Aminicenantes bacterium]NIN89877.1 protein kinase [Candidatus Aminicenantes bacterium]